MKTQASKLIFCFILASLCAGQTSTTVHRKRIPATAASPAAAQVTQAETEITKNNFVQAEALLKQAVALDANDFQAWYDLGYVQSALDKDNDAIAAYQKSIELNPKIFESNLNLGMLLAKQGENSEAAKFLRAATQLRPTSKSEEGLAHAWLALGQVLESSQPSEALQAFAEATKLQPQDAEAHLATAQLLERQERWNEAETEYQRAASMSKGEPHRAALVGLTNVAIATNSPVKAEAALNQYLQQNPEDAATHFLLGRVLIAQGKKEEAISELDNAAKAGSKDPEMLREKARLLSELQRYDDAAAVYKDLLQQLPKDAGVHHQYGIVLMQQHRFAEAQPELIAALQLDAGLGPAYGDLAVTASENKQYGLTVRALDARAKMMPETAATHFLRATAYDNLKQFPQATAEYKQFLAVANGKYPEKEWQARHRLVAIEKLK